MLTYHNNKKIKSSIVAEMKKHQKNDQFIKGSYSKMNGKFKGCAVGCAIDSFNIRLGKAYKNDSHKAFEEAIGVPEWLARLQDGVFENLPDGESSQFAVDLLDAIPVGVDLTPVKWKFSVYLLKENIDIVMALSIEQELKEKVVSSIRQCLTVNEDAVKTGAWNEIAAWSAARSAESAARSADSAAESAWSAAESAWSAARSAESAARSAESAAESAARSAARSAAESAAWSASSAASSAWSAWSAWSAAESAARSAAESAAYQRYAGELLRLLRNAK